MGSTELQGILQQLSGTTLDAQGCLQVLGANDFDWNGALAAIVPDQPSIETNWTDLTPLLVNSFTAGATTPEYRVMRSNRAETLDQRFYEFRGGIVTPDPKPASAQVAMSGLPFAFGPRKYTYADSNPGQGFNVVGRRYRIQNHLERFVWEPSGADVAGEENDITWIGPAWIEDEA